MPRTFNTGIRESAGWQKRILSLMTSMKRAPADTLWRDEVLNHLGNARRCLQRDITELETMQHNLKELAKC